MRIQNFNKNKNFIIINNRLSSVGFFHTTTIFYSNRTDNVRLEELFNLDKERVSNLQLIKYNMNKTNFWHQILFLGDFLQITVIKPGITPRPGGRFDMLSL